MSDNWRKREILFGFCKKKLLKTRSNEIVLCSESKLYEKEYKFIMTSHSFRSNGFAPMPHCLTIYRTGPKKQNKLTNLFLDI